MPRRAEVKEREHVSQCQHYWVIEEANGPKSRGICKYCGAIRDFFNVMPDSSAPKHGANPLHLPKMSKVDLDKDSQS